jgi:hypothetical protein
VSPRDVERVVDQVLHTFHEVHDARQSGVDLKRRFVGPARMKPEQAGIAARAKDSHRYATWFDACRDSSCAQFCRDRGFLAFPGMKSGEDKDFHGATPA